MISNHKGYRKRHRYTSMFFMNSSHIEHTVSCSKNHTKKLIVFPASFSLIKNNRSDVIKCINKIEELVINLNGFHGKIYLDFTKVRVVYPDAMILLYAEMSNIHNAYKNIRFKIINKSNSKVDQILQQLGMSKWCHHKAKVNKTIIRKDVKYWRSCSGVHVIHKDYDKIVEQDGILGSIADATSKQLYGACIEATKNASRHAYIENLRNIKIASDKASWWCFSEIKDKELTVVVCDLGVTIPYTLPKRREKLFKKLISLGKKTDADLIAGAIENPLSRSGEEYRGNGLPKIAELAKQQQGSMIILSRCGVVGISKQGRMKKRNFKLPINGTIVSWRIPIVSGVYQ